MRKRTFAVVAAATFAFGVTTSTKQAGAQDANGVASGQPSHVPPPPGYVPAYPPGYAPGPGYPTPLYPQTQPSYVLQSVPILGPPIIRNWSEGEPIPPGYHSTTRTRTGLVVGGAVMFGVSYFVSALVAKGNQEAALWVPAAGPFIQMFQNGNDAKSTVLLALDGIFQVGGISMFAIGLAVPKTLLVRNDVASAGPRLTIAPIVGPGHSGMGLVGTF
jgi:hypothetical protein